MNHNKKVIRQSSMGYHSVSSVDLGIQDVQVHASPVAFATWIRALLQNWRQGTVACKGRADVNRTNKKPWKQKGTGRARAGTARSPLWRGGGIIFGPMARARQLKENKKNRRSVMFSLLQERLLAGNVFVLDWLVDGALPKTTQAYRALQSAGLHEQKLLLFVAQNDALTFASFANLPNVSLVFFDQPNAFDAASGKNWAFLEKDKHLFKEMVMRWI